jgi:HEAT repeat protein
MPRSEKQKKKVEDLLAGIRSEDATVRTEAWQGAGKLGAAAIRLLAKVVNEEEGEVARAAKRGLWQVVRFKGAPEAKGKDRVIQRLIALLKDKQPNALRRGVVGRIAG